MTQNHEKTKLRVARRKLPISEIYSRHYNRVFAFMITGVSNRETARDLAQDVFVELLKTDPDPSSIKGSVSSYIKGIARHVLAHYYSNKPLLADEKDLDLLKVISAADQTHPIDIHRLQKCLDLLQERDSVILELHFVKGETHKEKAKSLGMTHDQVRQRFCRALPKLKECIGSRFLSHFDSDRQQGE
ncbi:sigma-70 family RNA polymerase sigma factor [Acidobacteriota bacterium]